MLGYQALEFFMKDLSSILLLSILSIALALPYLFLLCLMRSFIYPSLFLLPEVLALVLAYAKMLDPNLFDLPSLSQGT